ncbi:CLC_0170 family protein [Paenibacillus sepulcri]|uniref:Uncharacterized protein n=1 Tax=Paenibacillus sepulcri TaxID=359917 RepID=A0ABS7C232_9BACL|nr:hypothetical protein [Paenibacillus sepulcri]
MLNIHHAAYFVSLFLISGIFMLGVDRKIYQSDGMAREQLISRVMGWSNLIVAVLVFLGYLIYYLTR